MNFVVLFGRNQLKEVCPSLHFATVPSGPCCVWGGGRCRTHVASLSKRDAACPSCARHTLSCVFKPFKAVRQHSRMFGDGLLCQRKGLPLVCPLVGFKGVCLCRLCCARSNPLAQGFRSTGRTTRRSTGRTTGHAWDFHLPRFQFYGSALLSSTSNNHLLMYTLRRHQ